jgi:uncharacterized protein
MTRTDLEKLIPHVIEDSNAPESYHHGEEHWKCVAFVGVTLARATRGADPLVAFLFGLFHDTRRENENDDPDHGPRAAAFVNEVYRAGRLPITQIQLGKLLHACITHTESGPTGDPVVGCCYDADRLTLWRVGKVPAAEYISTDKGHEGVEDQWTEDLHDNAPIWDEILDLLFSPAPEPTCGMGVTAELYAEAAASVAQLRLSFS